MSTNIPLTGKFKVTCIFKKKGNWAAGYHTGIDMTCDNTKIYSSCDGTVYKTGWDESYGNYVVVKNSDDGKYHWFCHLSKINTSKGKKVTRTSVIGIMGNTGNSTGTHLHFEIRNKSNKYADVSDPASYMGIANKLGSYNTNDYQLNDEVDYYKKVSTNYTSIVDALKSINVDSSFSNRKKIAEKNGIDKYEGSSSQNIKLLNLLKEGKLKK